MKTRVTGARASYCKTSHGNHAPRSRRNSALKLAQYYLENKKPDRAKEKLEYILKKFPQTEAAKEAAKLMKEIK